MESPVAGAPQQVLGVVLEAERAQVGSAEAAVGASVFSGDALTTLAGGRLRVRVGTAQFYLPPDGTATLTPLGNGASARLDGGTVIFSTGGAEEVDVRVSDVRVRPSTAQATYAQVTLVSPCEVVVTSQRGTLEVTAGAEAHIVQEATSYRVVLDRDPQNRPCAASPAQRGSKPPAAGRSRILPIALVAISAGTGIVIWRALVSPDRP